MKENVKLRWKRQGKGQTRIKKNAWQGSAGRCGAGMGWAGQERTGHDRAEQSRGKNMAEKGCCLMVYWNFSATLFFCHLASSPGQTVAISI